MKPSFDLSSLVARLVVTGSVFALFSIGCTAPTEASEESEEAEQSLTRRSDLAADLAKKGGVQGTPFTQAMARDLNVSTVHALKALSERCLESEVAFIRSVKTMYGVKSGCAKEEIGRVSKNTEKLTERVSFVVAGQKLTAVMWDGDDSDGGDQVDVAFYAASGERIALYKSLYTNDDVLDNLGYISEATLREVQPQAPTNHN